MCAAVLIGASGLRSSCASIATIIDGELVGTVDVGGPHDGADGLLDLTEPDAVTEELTSRFSSDPDPDLERVR